MTPTSTVYRAAKLLVDQHGAAASLRTAERADALFEEGTWRVGGVAGDRHSNRRGAAREAAERGGELITRRGRQRCGGPDHAPDG
jgi:hypothetical protein